jgi:D-arabinose 1-dehydrogenase-like Zn-dependent alcohol dehydrogenase
MADKLEAYRRGLQVKGPNRMWPLYGAGFENLGVQKQPIEAPLPKFGPDQLLVRHDACGLCFSDVKVIALGEKHPRIYRDIRQEPVVLGHEVTMTVVGVGEKLRGQFRVGDRFIIQADIYLSGRTCAYGYMIQGGLSKYGVIDQRVLNGDDGNYLLPVQPQTGYAESALTEPWACVIAAYQLTYRRSLKPGGVTWILGTQAGKGPYSISRGLDRGSAPSKLLLTHVPAPFAAWLEARAKEVGVDVIVVEDPSRPPAEKIDDIVVLGPQPELIETASAYLANDGILAILADRPLSRPVKVDIGRVHYDGLLFVGTSSGDVAAAYSAAPVRSELKPAGRTWFIGAGGPMGRMHLQRTLQMAQRPAAVVCTDVSDLRLDDLKATFQQEAAARGVAFACLNPSTKAEYEAGMSPYQAQGFDDIVVLAPIPALIAEAISHLTEGGMMNIFAGVARGTMAALDLSSIYLRSVRLFGHSASTISDLRLMLSQAEARQLSPNRSVAAIGSLGAAYDGLQAVKDTTFPGKVVIFPNIKEMPLTALPDLKGKLPTVYAKLKDGREWTVEAEREFLGIMLED